MLKKFFNPFMDVVPSAPVTNIFELPSPPGTTDSTTVTILYSWANTAVERKSERKEKKIFIVLS